MAVICALHQPQLAERFADRILCMGAGQLSEEPASQPHDHDTDLWSG
jgi:ABC-type hemin transport system ATPase subunit